MKESPDMCLAKSNRTRRLRVIANSTGLLGVTGSLTCTVTMMLPLIAAGTAASTGGMTAMTGPAPTGLLGVLTRYGPIILIASVLLFTASVALRHPLTAVPALGAGALLYWGMYAQSSYLVMYLSLALGFAGWAVAYWWARSAGSSPAASTARQWNPRV